MKVLLVNGSPHPEGCTRRALDEVAKALTQDGIQTELLQLGKSPIAGCIACGHCATSGHCVFDDVVNELIDRAQTADGFIFGSPVYFAHPAGQILSALDRAFFAGGANFAQKPGAIVVSARRAGTTASLDALQKYLGISQMPIISATYWNMVHGNTPQEVEQDLEGLQTMRNLGHHMAWMLKCIAAGKEAGIQPPLAEGTYRTNFIR
ncbi:MAG TPA: flavodoxin family protein [Firmicutes bacterium]|nr:flavodoxin family protein [Bacillota bacterium]